MKKSILNHVVCALLVFGIMCNYSCDNEPINSEEQENLRKGKNGPKGPKANLSSYNLFQTCQFDSATNLYAGQNILVGEVTVEELGENYIITYNIYNNGYCISETHLSVVNDPEEFPINGGGNPKIGHFEYSGTHDCVSSVEYVVPIEEGPYIAAHAVVNCVEVSDGNDIDATFPETLNFCLRTGREVEDAEGYFKLSVAEGPFAGNYWAWCADVSLAIDASGADICYEDFNVLSLSDDLSEIISETDNIDNVLWLINNINSIDSLLGLEDGSVLYGYIQWALWKLLNNQDCSGCNDNLNLPAGDYTILGNQIVDLALNNGDGYIPGCDEFRLMFLTDGVRQPLFFPVPINCSTGDCDETAWADGCDFPGNSWATYFQYAD